MRAVCIAVCWLLCGCPASLRRPGDKQVNLAGTVYFGGDVQRGDPLEGATITVTRAADGIALGSNVSSSTGGWRITFAADPDTRVVVGFSAPGLVPNFRALDVGPFTDAQVSVALEPPDPMECTDSQCVSAADDLSLGDVPDNLIGSARVFEASTETPRLVGLELFRPLVVATLGPHDQPSPTFRSCLSNRPTRHPLDG